MHQPQLGAEVGVGGTHEHTVLGGADGTQTVVGVVTEAVTGDSVEVDAVIGDQQVEALLGLLRIVVAAEVVNEVMDQLVVDDLVQNREDLVHGLTDRVLQVIQETSGSGFLAGVEHDAGLSLVISQEGGLAHEGIQQSVNLSREVLIVHQHLAVLGNGVLVSGHIGSKTAELLIQFCHEVGEDGVLQEPLQVCVVLLTQQNQQRIHQDICTAADVFVIQVCHLAVGDLRQLIAQGRGVVSADVELVIVDAHTPDILVGVVAKTHAQVADGAFGEVGVVVVAADLLEVAVGIHPVQVDGVIQVVVQQLVVAASGDLSQIQHGVIVGTQIQVTVINPHVAGHGVVDAHAEAVAAGAVIADDLSPGEVAVCVLLAAVHGEALLVDLAVDVLVGDDGDIQIAVILNDVPNAAAVQTVDLQDSGQAVEVVLVSNNTPLFQTGAGIGAGNNDAAGVALAVIVVGGQTHHDLAVINQQTMAAVGNGSVIVDVVVYDICFVGGGINLNQSCGGIANANKVQLALEFEGHTVAGQVVLGGQEGRVAGEDLGILSPDVALAEHDLGFAGDLVNGHDDGSPLIHHGFVKGVHTEDDFHQVSSDAVDIHGRIQQTGGLHVLQGSQKVVVVNVESGVVAGADVDVVAGLCHGPGVAVAAVLFVAGQDAVNLTGAQGGVGDLIHGVAAVGVGALLKGDVADVAVFIAGDAVIGGSAHEEAHDQTQYDEQRNASFGFHCFSSLS